MAAFHSLFERIAECLSENIAGHGDLEPWFNRPVETSFENRFGLTPTTFQKVITSRSLNNEGGGHLDGRRTIREVKIDAVQRVLEQLTAPEADDSFDESERMARFTALRKRAGISLAQKASCDMKLAVWQITKSIQSHHVIYYHSHQYISA